MRTITDEYIQALIVSEHFIDLPNDKGVYCILTLKSGAITTGEAIVADIANSDPKKGREISRRKAIEALWELESYRAITDEYESNTKAGAGEV